MNVSFSASKGHRIVAADSATSVGRVDDLLLDASATRVAAVGVEGHGHRSHVVRWASITAFGGDAVMARSAADVDLANSEQSRASGLGDYSVIGKRVLTVDGSDAGSVTDVEFDPVSGVVGAVVTDHERVDGRRVRSIGSYALIVDMAVHMPLPDPAGNGAT